MVFLKFNGVSMPRVGHCYEFGSKKKTFLVRNVSVSSLIALQ